MSDDLKFWQLLKEARANNMFLSSPFRQRAPDETDEYPVINLRLEREIERGPLVEIGVANEGAFKAAGEVTFFARRNDPHKPRNILAYLTVRESPYHGDNGRKMIYASFDVEERAPGRVSWHKVDGWSAYFEFTEAGIQELNDCLISGKRGGR